MAVARALIFEPSFVRMDKPLGALDKQLREQMQFEIKAIHARPATSFVAGFIVKIPHAEGLPSLGLGAKVTLGWLAADGRALAP